MRKVERPASAPRVATGTMMRWIETALLSISAVGLFLVFRMAKLLGMDLGESASDREDAEELQRAAARDDQGAD